MSDSLFRILDNGCQQLGVELSDSAARRTLNYLKLLIKWNRRINLCGTRSERELLELHILDGFAILPHIPADATRLVDVGSGAGFTAIVAAIAVSNLAVTALEPAHKKHAFLSAVRRELALENLTPLAKRLEDHLAEPDASLYDVAVSRATWSLPEWLERGTQLVRKGGVVLGMEGATAHPLPAGASRHEYPLANRTRSIVVVRL